MFQLLIFFNLILFCYVQCKIPAPILDGEDSEQLSINTNSYYAIKNIKTGTYLYDNVQGKAISDSISLWSGVKLDLFDDSLWFNFQNDFDNLFNIYTLVGSKNQFSISFQKQDYYFNIIYRNKNNPHSFICRFADDMDGKVCKSAGYTNVLWQFIPAANHTIKEYNIYAKMSKFNYTKPNEDEIRQHKKVDLVQTSKILNCSPDKTTERFTIEQSTSQKYGLTIDKSLSYTAKYCQKFSISAEVGDQLFGIGSKISTSAEFDQEIGMESKEGRSENWINTKETKISIENTVNIPPYQCYTVLGYYNFINNIQIEYSAAVSIHIERNSGETIDQEQMRKLARLLFFDQQFSNTSDTYLVFNTSGIITSTFGIDIFQSVKSSGKNCSCEGELKEITYY